MRINIKTDKGTQGYELESFGKSEIRFGRKPGNDIVIDSSIVSGNHGAFIKKADGWYIADLGSTNGLLSSDGKKITEKRLHSGSQYGVKNQNTMVVMTVVGEAVSEVKKVQVMNDVQKVKVMNPAQTPVPLSSMNEEVLATLYMDRLHSWLSGYGICEIKATLTNKRVYMRRRNGLISKIDSTETIDNADITGVKIVDYKPWMMVGFGALLLVLAFIFWIASVSASSAASAVSYSDFNSIFRSGASWAAGMVYSAFASMSFIGSIILLISAWFNFRKLIIIQYAGGFISVNLKFVNYNDIVYFRDCILVEKENCKRVYGNKKVNDLDDVTYKY